MKKNNNKGFTLAELLIVVAIIAVLTAIAIPVFTSQLEKSRESTDMANIRSAYAVIQSAALVQDDQDTLTKNNTADAKFTVSGAEGTYKYQAVVQLKQQQAGWQSVPDGETVDVGGIELPAAVAKGKATIVYDQATNVTTVTIA